MKKVLVILSVFIILFCSMQKHKEQLLGNWDAVYSEFYNVVLKEEAKYLPPDLSGGISFTEKGWSINCRREDGYQIKGGGSYDIKGKKVILKFYKSASWFAILENDTLSLDIKPTMPDPEDPNFLLSVIDGHILFKGNILVEIEPEYVINGDIDFNTGNINYVGSVLIKGDVKSGFEVKVDGDVDIWGVVEDAKITAGGSVLLQKGIIGRGAGIVECEGELISKYVENQNIRSKSNVTVAESILHSKVYTDKKVIVKGKKGHIIGGEIIATTGVEVKNLGNYQNIRTEVSVGIKEETKRKLLENELNIEKNRGNISNVKKAIYQLIQLKYSKNGLTPEKAGLLAKMQKIQKILPAQNEELEKEKEEMSKAMQMYKNAEIKVFNKVYPGVKISILDKKYSVLEERSYVSFKLLENEVVCTKLEK